MREIVVRFGPSTRAGIRGGEKFRAFIYDCECGESHELRTFAAGLGKSDTERLIEAPATLPCSGEQVQMTIDFRRPDSWDNPALAGRDDIPQRSVRRRRGGRV